MSKNRTIFTLIEKLTDIISVREKDKNKAKRKFRDSQVFKQGKGAIANRFLTLK